MSPFPLHFCNDQKQHTLLSMLRSHILLLFLLFCWWACASDVRVFRPRTAGRPIRTILVLLYGTAMGIDLGALWVEGICSRSVSYHTSSVIYILSSKSHCYLKFSDLLVLIIMVQSESFPSIFFPIFFCDLRMLSEIVQGGRLFQGVKVCENTRHDPNPFLIRLYIIFLQPDCPVFLDCQHVSASSGFTQTKNKLYNIATM